MMKYEEIVPLNKQEQELTDRVLEKTGTADADLTGLEMAVLSRLDAGDEIPAEQKSARRLFRGRKRRNLLLAAAMMIILTTFVYGAAEGWNVELARALGFSDMMEELQGGYVNIGLTQKQDKVTMTVDQAVGDDSSQWILITTDIPYETAGQNESVVYYADKFTLNVSRLFGGGMGGGESLESFNNNGKVAFWLFASSYDKINKSRLKLSLGKIRREVMDQNGKTISNKKVTGASFSFKWRNHYKAHSRTYAEDVKVVVPVDEGSVNVTCRLRKIRITPVTIYLEATYSGPSVKGTMALIVEEIQLKNGAWRKFSVTDGDYGNDEQDDTTLVYSYQTLGERYRAINGSDITGIMVGGTKIELK
jgi:hypothetical protein